jgi:cytochrome P450
LIQPVFQPQHVAEYGPVIDASITEMLDAWEASAGRGERVDIVAEMMGLTLTIAARVLFRADIRAQIEIIQQALAVILQDTWRRLETPLDLAAISPLFHRPRFRRAVREVDQVVLGIISRRRQDGGGGADLLSRLLRAHQAYESQCFSDRELRDAVLTLLLAGHETTANALANAFCLIARSPPTQQRLTREAKLQPTAAAGSQLTAARNTFAEAIRLYPSIWIIERRVVSDDQIGGYAIPRGSTVILSPYLLHRHPDFWQAAEKFDPQRFAPGRDANRPRHAYIPFGVGPHRCIGEHMAQLVATRILSRVHGRFHLGLVADQVIQHVPGITLRHDRPVWMHLKRLDRDTGPTDVFRQR